MIARLPEVFLNLAPVVAGLRPAARGASLLAVLLEPDELVVDRVQPLGFRVVLLALEAFDRLREVVQRLVEVAGVLIAGVLSTADRESSH